MTGPDGNAVQSTDLFAPRMAIAELFRDGQDGRYRLGLAQMPAETAGQLDPLILIATLALILLSGLGWVAEPRFHPSVWCSSNAP
jgi:hypothetical protein